MPEANKRRSPISKFRPFAQLRPSGKAFRRRRASALGDADRREALEPGLSFRRQAAVARHRSLPTTTLKEARARRDEAKRQLKAGLDPSHQKRLAKLAVAADQANTLRSPGGRVSRKRKSSLNDATGARSER